MSLSKKAAVTKMEISRNFDDNDDGINESRNNDSKIKFAEPIVGFVFMSEYRYRDPVCGL